MKLLIKPKSTNLDNYIEKKAQSFLIGMKGFSSFMSIELHLNNIKELKNKYPNIELFVGIDKNIFNKELIELKNILIELDTLSLAGIFFYDLAVLNIAQELDLKTPLVWNQSFLAVNSRTCNYYFDKGVKMAHISSEITLDEIKQISNKTNIDIIISIFGYQLMSLSKRKFISNYLEYIGEFDKIKEIKIINEGQSYNVIEDNETKILSSYVLNGLTKLQEFKSLNIKYLVLDEIDIDHEIFLKVLSIYNEGLTSDDIDKLDLNIKELIPNTSLGFLNTKTIYKVK